MNNNTTPMAVFDVCGDGRTMEVSEAGLTLRCADSGWFTPWKLVWVEESEDDFTLQLDGQGLDLDKDEMSWEQMEELRRLLLRFCADRYRAPGGRMPR